ncbi:MAG: glyoxylase-like metal-dependent hydrolase (beta-lactamase superfamily II) [Candidatus Azotimanducaceae bacterium]|jgi:glyoxylase-like metal-dependent hydrolase (beta-lactamase superfamily II)
MGIEIRAINLRKLSYVARVFILFFFLGFCSLSSFSEPLKLTKVTEQVYSAIGEPAPPSFDNGGHNNNLSVVISDSGILVVNGGANYLLAKRLHQAIAIVSDQPVLWVVNENGQGHAFLGNSYWRDQGVKIIAHKNAVEEIKNHGEVILKRMQNRQLEKSEGTYVAVPDNEFDDFFNIQLGQIEIELRYFGPAHSPGDISVWLPESKVIIAGDIAFHQRLLAIFPDTDVKSWIESFENLANLEPLFIIPGHGSPTDINSIQETTQGYLQFLTQAVLDILDDDGGLAEAYAIDQSEYAHLKTFNELATKNAGRLFQTLEMEAF